MTPEEQRIAIAEACPQTIRQNISIAGYWAENPCWEWFDGSRWSQCRNNDPLNDLNAMHEAWKILTEDQHHNFRVHLVSIVHRDGHIFGPCKSADNASAAQRAEAFLRTLGKWVD